MKCTYLLLHPCACTIVDQIFNILKKNNIIIKAVYRIHGWNAILDDIYRNTYTKSITIEAHVQAHAYINNYLFGNNGLILLLYKKIPYNELIKETINVKHKLRQTVNKTKDGTITIFLDANKSIYRLCKNKSKDTSQTHIRPDENKLKIFLSYIHCPDTIEQYMEDFEILRDYLKKELTAKEVEAIIKYHSFY